MFKYTVNSEIRHNLKKIKKNVLDYEKEYAYVCSMVKTYAERIAMSRYILDVEFYSPKRVQFVPVNGIMFPVEMFTEEII